MNVIVFVNVYHNKIPAHHFETPITLSSYESFKEIRENFVKQQENRVLPGLSESRHFSYQIKKSHIKDSIALKAL